METMEQMRKASTIRLGAFDGMNIPLETHLAKLNNCSAYYNWTSSDRVCHLKASLEGAAATLLWQLPTDCSEEQLVQLLRSRFGTADMIERFRCELRQRRRKCGESIQSVYNDVCRLIALSYPGETGELSRLVARDAFLDCLGDPEMRVRVLERGATSIDEAYTIAARHETYVAAARVATSPSDVSQSLSYGVRAVGLSTEYHQPSPLDQRLSVLEQAVSSLTGEMQSWRCALPQAYEPTNARPSPGVPFQQLGEQRRERLCYVCQSPGHLRRQCPLRTSLTTGPAKTGNGSSTTSATKGNVDLITPISSTEALLPARIIKSGGTNLDSISVLCVLDSGASHAILPAKYCFQEILPTKISLKTVSGESLPIIGVTKAQILLGNTVHCVEFVVSNVVDEVLLSIAFLADMGAIWNFKESSIEIACQSFQLRNRQSDNCVKRVYATNDMCIEPHAVAIVPVSLKYTSLDVPACTTWLVEPKAINASLLMPRMILSGSDTSVVQLVNCTDKTVVVKPGLALGTALGICLNTLGDGNCHVSDDDDYLFSIGGSCIFDTPSTSTCQFTGRETHSAPSSAAF